MVRRSLLPALVFLILCGGCKLPSSMSSLFEGCYDPLAGHPTAQEKLNFINKAIPYAQDAEKISGVPAAAILAIASVESGYGFTKTARFANNLFGWKFYGPESAGGRSFWTLSCQPSWDPNNKYVKFADFRDSIIFVGEKLATLKDLGRGKRNYKAKTDRYVTDRKNGVEIKTAVNRWIDGIADAGYNYSPGAWKTKIKSLAANLENPKAGYSDKYNSYQYSQNIVPKSGLTPPPTPQNPAPPSQPTPPSQPAPSPQPTPPPAPPAKSGFDVEGVVHMLGNEENRLGNAYITFGGKTTTSQETGYFMLENVPPGHHEFVVKMEGFNDKIVAIDVKDQSLEIYVGLSPR